MVSSYKIYFSIGKFSLVPKIGSHKRNIKHHLSKERKNKNISFIYVANILIIFVLLRA